MDTFDLVVHDLPVLLEGAQITLGYCLLAMPLALLVGLLVHMADRSGVRPLHALARMYIEVIRGTPFVIQMYAIYYGLAFLRVGNTMLITGFTGGLAVLVLNYFAYEAENFRTGIGSVDPGQREAAYSLGLDGIQTMQRIILPQAVRVIIPPVVNDLVYMFKDRSILSLIAVTELTGQADFLATHGNQNNFIPVFVLAAAIYVLMSYPIARLASYAESQLRARL